MTKCKLKLKFIKLNIKLYTKNKTFSIEYKFFYKMHKKKHIIKIDVKKTKCISF